MIFVKGLTHKSLALDVDLDETVATVRCALQVRRISGFAEAQKTSGAKQY